jgi:hypothetical protein
MAIINKRQMEDMEAEQNRRAEDEKYHASLANRARKTGKEEKGGLLRVENLKHLKEH